MKRIIDSYYDHLFRHSAKATGKTPHGQVLITMAGGNNLNILWHLAIRTPSFFL